MDATADMLGSTYRVAAYSVAGNSIACIMHLVVDRSAQPGRSARLVATARRQRAEYAVRNNRSCSIYLEIIEKPLNEVSVDPSKLPELQAATDNSADESCVGGRSVRTAASVCIATSWPLLFQANFAPVASNLSRSLGIQAQYLGCCQRLCCSKQFVVVLVLACGISLAAVAPLAFYRHDDNGGWSAAVALLPIFTATVAAAAIAPPFALAAGLC
ncbi:MAG: hypothetical protein R3C56_29450 [Pirellulaceae bacterium]